jgi:hypothetical protein
MRCADLVAENERLRSDNAVLRKALSDLLRVVGQVAYTTIEETERLSSVERAARLVLETTKG